MLSKIFETAPVALARKLKDTVNAVIDELSASRLVAGHGISISRYPSGTVISATAQPGGGTSVSSTEPIQFTIIDASTTDSETGAVTQSAIRIVDGRNPSSLYCGTFNGSTYRAETLQLSGSGTWRIYVIDHLYPYKIVAIKNTFYSDICPSALIGTVSVAADGAVTITSQNVVPSQKQYYRSVSEYIGSFELTPTLTNGILHVQYRYSGGYFFNNVQTRGQFMLATDKHYIVAYVVQLMIGINDTPQSGCVLVNSLNDVPTHETQATLLQYTLTQTDSVENFEITVIPDSRPWLFTFVAITSFVVEG